MKKILFTLSCLALCSISNTFAQKLTSFYSSTAPKHVAILEDSALEKNPEIDHLRHLCPGYGGYELIHHGGDLRSAIDIKFGKTVSNLTADTFKNTIGAFPHKANDVVEWRGTLIGDNFTPHAIIYRMAASVEIQGKQITKTVLVVVALNKGKSIILGAVSGKNEGTKARSLADAILRKR